MPSVGMQMPGMYLRGSLCNVTMRNLNDEQQLEVAEIVDEIKDDPLLQAARVEFRNALRYTIKGDYLDTEAADQEYQISLWRAVVAAKFGWGSHESSEQTITDSKQRKKFFQTWVFNYLRQILNENKRATIKTTQVVLKSKWELVVNKIVSLVGEFGTVLSEKYNKACDIRVNLFLCSSSIIDELHELRIMYLNNEILIDISDDIIEIRANQDTGYEMIEVTTPTLVTTSSIHADENDNNNSSKDIEALDQVGFKDPDTIGCLYENISETAQKVLMIITNPSEDYVEKYGEKPVKRYIAEHLSLTPKQVKDIWTELKLAYTVIIGSPD